MVELAKNSDELTMVFHGVAYEGNPRTIALDGVGGAMETGGSITQGVNEAVRGHLEVILEHDGLSGLPQTRSLDDVKADFAQEQGVIGYTTTTARITKTGQVASVESSFEALHVA